MSKKNEITKLFEKISFKFEGIHSIILRSYFKTNGQLLISITLGTFALQNLIYLISTWLEVNKVGDIPPPISCAPAVEVAVLTRCRPVLLIDPG